MLSLLYLSQEDISEKSTRTIIELLKISPAPDMRDFLNNSEEKDFYFFFDSLIENNVACAISADWKWEPDDIFWQLEKYFTDHIKLVSSEWIQSDESYQIEYTYDGKSTTLNVPFTNPDELLDSVSQHLKDRKFIAINFLDDSYSWLIVPKDFDTELFCALTGLAVERPASRIEIPKNFAEGFKQTEKLFFSPSIIYVDEKQTGYEMPGQIWAGRILPGQTIREGIAAELKTELNYLDRFDYSYDGFEGVFKDRKGRDIKRYRLTVYLFDKTFQSKMAGGADIRLRKISNKVLPAPKGS